MRRRFPTMILLILPFAAVSALFVVAIVTHSPMLTAVASAASVLGLGTYLAVTLTLLRLGRASLGTVSRRVSKVSQTLRDQQRTMVTKDSLKAGNRRLHENLDSLTAELGAAEFRLGARTDQVPEFTLTALTETSAASQRRLLRAGADEGAAMVQLIHHYDPTRPVGSAGPSPAVMLAVLTAAREMAPRRVLTLGLEDQVTWLGYALGSATITAVDSPSAGANNVGDKDANTTSGELARHGFSDRITPLTVAPGPVDVPHHHLPWFDLDSRDVLAGPFDVVVLGSGDATAYPAVPMLAHLVAPGGYFLVPAADSQVIQAWLASGWVVTDATISVSEVSALRVQGRHTRADAATFGLASQE